MAQTFILWVFGYHLKGTFTGQEIQQMTNDTVYSLEPSMANQTSPEILVVYASAWAIYPATASPTGVFSAPPSAVTEAPSVSCYFTSPSDGECLVVDYVTLDTSTGARIQISTRTLSGSATPITVLITPPSTPLGSAHPSLSFTFSSTSSVISPSPSQDAHIEPSSDNILNDGGKLVGVTIGSIAGALFILVTVLLLLLRRRKSSKGGHSTDAQAFNLSNAIGIPTTYDLKPEWTGPSQELESHLPKTIDKRGSPAPKAHEVVLAYNPSEPPGASFVDTPLQKQSESESPPLTERQQLLQEQASFIRDEISAITERASATTGVSEDTVVVQRRIIAELNERVRMLEGMLATDWARGLTDDPPPLYTEMIGLAV